MSDSEIQEQDDHGSLIDAALSYERERTRHVLAHGTDPGASATLRRPNLIAASPELLEALTKIRDWAQVAVSLDCPIPPKTRNRILKVARAAIDKAATEESA